MKQRPSRPSRPSADRGSALITVILLMFAMALLSSSMLTYTVSERRGNERNRLVLRAKNMAENTTIYAAEQLTTKIYRLGSAPEGIFPWTGTSLNRIYIPPDQVLDNPPFTWHTSVEMRAGIEAATGLVFVNDVTNPNNGLQVNTARVPIIAKATATLPVLGSVTAYVEQDMALGLMPLFQFGMFYNMDMEVYPSKTFTVTGPVHTNNRLMAHPDAGQTIAITFTDRVTAAGGIYSNAAMKTVTRYGDGHAPTVNINDGDVFFTHTNKTTQVSLKDTTSDTNRWRDHKFKTSPLAETTSSIAQFKLWTTNTFNGNLRSSAHGVTKLELPGIGTYAEQNIADDPDTDGNPATDLVDERNNGRQIIEPPDAKKWTWNSGTSTGSWDAHTDEPALKNYKLSTKISWKSGLYIIANPDSEIRSCTLPDGNTAYLLPHSYRTFLNSFNSTFVHTVTEVVLPGQPTYGYNNNGTTADFTDDYNYRNYLPNRYNINTVNGGGPANQVLRSSQEQFGTASGYQVNNGAGIAPAATTIAISEGTGPIPVGETITIKGYKYLVTSTTGTPVTSITIAPPGIRDATNIPDNTPVTIDRPGNAPGTGKDYQINNGAGYAINATNLTVNTGLGTIMPGNIVTIGANKYTVASTVGGATVTSIRLTSGLIASVVDDTPVTVDSASGTVGNGTLWQLSGAHLMGVTSLTLDTGSGTLLPGNTIIVTRGSGGTARKYLVTSALSGGVVKIAPALYGADGVDNDTVTVDPASGSLGTGMGYFTSAAAATNTSSLAINTGTGTILPGNTLAIGSNQYLVTSAAGSPVTAVTLASPLLADVANNTLVIVDPFPVSGYARFGGGGAIYPADDPVAATVPYLVPAPAYFYDMRRANSNRGVISITGTQAYYDRYTVPYVPRPVAKIDFDMARFKMMVTRVMSDGSVLTSSGYDLRAPTLGATWANSIYRTDSTAADLGLGMGVAFDVFPAATTVITKTRPDPYRLYYTSTDFTTIMTNPTTLTVPSSALVHASNPSAWYDGIAIYLHSVDAETRKQTVAGTPDRIDSGVRLWNGRGVVATLIPATYPGKTGFTFVTNDAAYIIGHFNANGAITTATNTISSRYPDNTSEMLCSVMADAITILSQPTWGNATNGQTNGWNDALSALPDQDSTSGWRTGAGPGSGLAGDHDGVTTTDALGVEPGLLPTDHSQVTAVAAARNTKLVALDTEISTALLVGIVPTNHRANELTDGFTQAWTHTATGDPLIVGNQVNAGGANNFPRLMESWASGSSLYIRGAMIALYESRVAMEPFTNSRCYSAPNRYWGLHENFRTAGHDLPLEPIVLGATRAGFRELTKKQYDDQKIALELLTRL